MVKLVLEQIVQIENPEVSGNIKLPDNNKLILGTGSDAELYWDGTNAVLNTTDASNGSFYIMHGSRTYITKFNDGSTTQLYNAGSINVETSASGLYGYKGFISIATSGNYYQMRHASNTSYNTIL